MNHLASSSVGAAALLRLLQLSSPALPVGAYSYSEGLETLVQREQIQDDRSLEHWLVQELQHGAIHVEAALLLRVYDAALELDVGQLSYWNQWLSAFRETEELREQSWQMGRSLVRLCRDLHPEAAALLAECGEPCNFVVAFAVAAAGWHIDRRSALLGYLHSWVSNLVNAGVRLVPLGQTQGQQLLLRLYPVLEQAANAVETLSDDELQSCSWGWTIASMAHETLYSRLFRS